jgi:hypothetical protein
MPMYHLLEDGKAIRCLRCHLVSHHPQDVENRYCVRCHLFLDQEAPYEHFIRLLSCVQACYKYTWGDRQMPLESLQALMLDTLEHVMGQDTLARWLQREQIQREGQP